MKKICLIIIVMVLTSGLVVYAKSNDKKPQQQWDVITYSTLKGANEDIAVGDIIRYTEGSTMIVEKRHYDASGRNVIEIKCKLLGHWYTFQNK